MPDVRETGRVDVVLDRLGLGSFDWAGATAASGRNDNWLGRTSGGRQVFVKTLVGSEIEVAHGLRRTEAFYRTLEESGPPGALRTAALIGQDESVAVQVFELLEGAGDGRRAAMDGAFGTAMAAKAGSAIGALHSVSPARLLAAERTLPPLPRHDHLAGLTMETFYEASFAQLEAWSVLQRDPVVVDSIMRLETSSINVPRVPVHGDLCLDQFLVAGEELYLVDWEAFGLGDPARDVGAFAGEWLHHTVTGFLGEREKNGTGKPVAAPNIALTPHWPPWQPARSTVESFWAAYRAAQPPIPAGFAIRATLFVAWHLLMRVLTDAISRPRLDGTGHTLFRLARMILLSPARFTTILGLGDRP